MQENPYAPPRAEVADRPPVESSAQEPFPTAQVVLFVFIVGGLAFFTGGPIGAALVLALGGATFADAWQAGIRRRPWQSGFLNISPVAWAVVMSWLFIVAYPAYLINRKRLQTKEGNRTLYWLVVVLGMFMLASLLLRGLASRHGNAG